MVSLSRHCVAGLSLLVVALAAITPASAQNPACDKPYDADQLVVDIMELEQAIISVEAAEALRFASSIHDRIICVEQRLPLSFLGRTYRGLGGAFFVGGDTERADRWFRTAIELDRTYRYGVEDLPTDHPVREAYGARVTQPEAEISRIEGKVFVEGDYFLDGRRLTRPGARPDRFHIFQREHEGKVKTWLITGPDFPESMLTAEPGTEDKGGRRQRRERTRFTGAVQEMGSSAMVVERSSPPEQVPLVIGGATAIVAGVGLYVGSYYSRENFGTIRDDEDRLRKSQRLTNRLFMGSLAAIAVGSGVMTYGIIVDDAGRPIGPRVDIRF